MQHGTGFEADLERLLEPIPADNVPLCRAVVHLIGAMPDLVGQVRFGWRSVNFRHQFAGLVCAVFPHADRVAVYFENGRVLEDPDGLLQGDHLKKGRFLRLRPGDSVPGPAIALLVAEAIALKL